MGRKPERAPHIVHRQVEPGGHGSEEGQEKTNACSGLHSSKSSGNDQAFFSLSTACFSKCHSPGLNAGRPDMTPWLLLSQISAKSTLGQLILVKSTCGSGFALDSFKG